MAADSWSYFSSPSKRHQAAAFQSQLGLDDIDGAEEESGLEFACPFCPENFDIVGFCCHIEDEHPVEANIGVCPFCDANVGFNLVVHLTVLHASFFEMERRKRSHKGSSGSRTIHSLSKKDLLEANLRSLSDGSSFMPSNTTPDSLLSSFILDVPAIEALNDARHQSLDEESYVDKPLNDKAAESVEKHISDKDHRERALRSKFARVLILSTIFDEDSY